MNRKGPWEGYRQQAKPKAKPRCVLPAFLCAHIFIKRETSGYEAATALVGKSNGKDTITTHFDWKKQKRILLVDR